MESGPRAASPLRAVPVSAVETPLIPPSHAADSARSFKVEQESNLRLCAVFQPSRDEPWRPSEPETMASGGVTEALVEAIVFRFMLNVGEAEGRSVADQLKLPFRMVEPVLAR